MIAPALLCAALLMHDGDSGRCQLPTGQTVKVRLAGIDAPESAPYTRCRQQPTIWACRPERRRLATLATTRARELAAHGAECRPTGERPSHGRVIARCFVNGRDLGAILVSEGLAISEREFGDQYRREEDEARRRGRGVWIEEK